MESTGGALSSGDRYAALGLTRVDGGAREDFAAARIDEYGSPGTCRLPRRRQVVTLHMRRVLTDDDLRESAARGAGADARREVGSRRAGGVVAAAASDKRCGRGQKQSRSAPVSESNTSVRALPPPIVPPPKSH